MKIGTQVPLTAWAVYAPINVPQKPMNIATIAQSAKLFFPVPLPFESIFWHLVEYFLQKKMVLMIPQQIPVVMTAIMVTRLLGVRTEVSKVTPMAWEADSAAIAS